MSRNSLINILLVSIGAFLGFFLCEGGLRLYYFGSLAEPLPERHLREPHKTLGWCLTPNKTAFQQTLDYSVRIKINSKGLRDIEHSYSKEADVFRIVILGDSFMEAYQVPLECSFPRVLEKVLNERVSQRIEVINLGVGGYGTAQEYLYLREEGLKYHPDLVILAFLGLNDVRNNSRTLEAKLWGSEDVFKIVARPFYVRDDGNLMLREPNFEKARKIAEARESERRKRDIKKRILLYRLVNRKLTSMKAEPHYGSHDLRAMLGSYFPKYDKDWREAWDITKQLILMIHKLSLEHDAAFFLFSVPSKFQIEKDYFKKGMSRYLTKDPNLRIDLEKPDRILKAFCELNNIPCLSLTGQFRTYYEHTNDRLYHSIVDQHWNEKGHELASEIVAGYLISERLL